MLTLLELLLLEIAGNQRSAVAVHAISEVAAGHTGLASREAHQLPFIDECPLLHLCTTASSTSVLGAVTGVCPAVDAACLIEKDYQ